LCASAIRRWPLQVRSAHVQHTTTASCRDNWSHGFHASDVVPSSGYGFKVSRKMSLSRTRSPIFCLSFLICSLLSVALSFGRVRRAFSAPSRNFSRQSATSATVNPCMRSLRPTDVTPFRMPTTKATRRLAVHRSMGITDSAAISTSLVHSGPCRRRWSQFHGDEDNCSNLQSHIWKDRVSFMRQHLMQSKISSKEKTKLIGAVSDNYVSSR